MKKIRIELQSDTCFASGELYNSSIDTDVCYDEYGLPFIPAKRIKGCLRESALELFEFELSDFEELHLDVEELFGTAGKQEALFSLQSAKLENYVKYVQELKNCTKKQYKTQQAVLNQFTYIRQQTSIDNVTGTAEETTLRSMRVMKKGLVFEAQITISDKYDGLFEKICKNVRFMGVNRNRGMGELILSYIKEDTQKECLYQKNENAIWNDKKEYHKLSYTMQLQSPMILKSVAGGQSRTIPYIEGSKILGMIVENRKTENDFAEWGKELICSNAYISDETTRYVPISNSVYHVKNKKTELRDKAYENAVLEGNQEGLQLCQLNEYYVSSDTEIEISKLAVKTELHYHHTRPQDKSKGHVVGDSNSEENGKLFYMESIAEGQIFAGYILGSKEQLRYIYDFLTKNPFQKIGFSKNVEYGQVLVSVCGLEEKEQKKEMPLSKFIVKLNAPTIIYNENRMYSTDENVLLRYIEEKLDSKNLQIVNRFLGYDTIGGYQTTWEAHKPIIAVFDKGTTLVLKTKDGTSIDISKLQGIHLGERIQEGYGELSVYALPSVYERRFVKRDENVIKTNSIKSNDRKIKSALLSNIILNQTDIRNTNDTKINNITSNNTKADIRSDSDIEASDITSNQSEINAMKSSFIPQMRTETSLISNIALTKAKEHIKFLARESAKKIKVNNQLKAVNANLLLMCEQQESFTEFEQNIVERYRTNTILRTEKLRLTRTIISENLKISDIRKDAITVYPEAEPLLSENIVYKMYVKSLLLAIKYAIRGEEADSGK